MSDTKADLHTNCSIRHSTNEVRYTALRNVLGWKNPPNDAVAAEMGLYIFTTRGSEVPNIFNFAVLVKRSNFAKRQIAPFFFGGGGIFP